MELSPGLRREAPPDLDSVGQDDALVARIRAEIAGTGPITFARFMEFALYDPSGGYYRSEAPRPGRSGDFLTAPETHPIFGAALARCLGEVWEALSRPDPFVLREYGGGAGTLITAILSRLEVDRSPLADALRYVPVEIEPARVATAVDRLAALGRADQVAVAVVPDDPIVGAVFGNEVLDALPTHRVVQRGARLLEVYVGLDGGRFIDVEGPPTTADLAARLHSEGISLADGQRGEICLGVDDWVAAAAAGLERGVLLLIDYGHPAKELYDPVRRRDGTLRAYIRQRVHDDPYRHVGRQDLTAHVDVSAVERTAARAGLDHLGTTSQAEFLVGSGAEALLQEIQADPATTLEAYLAVRSGLMRLLDPAAMGRFRVMGFGRGWPADTSLAGFTFRIGR